MMPPKCISEMYSARSVVSCPPCSVCDEVNAAYDLVRELPFGPQTAEAVEERAEL